MILPLVVLLPGPDVRVLGMSVRLRNERVARRAGAEVVPHDTLDRYRDRSVIVVPPGCLLDFTRTDSLVDVSTPGARRRVAWDILRRTEKSTDGWFSRTLNRPISRTVSYLLLSLRLNANHAS